MKLKYYLRGLGIGIIVTAAIMSVTASKKAMAMTDAQIKERAAEMGMIEDTFLADAVKKIDAAKEAVSTESINEQETETATEEVTEQTAAKTAEQETVQPIEPVSPTMAETEPNAGISEELLEIIVKSGESSVSISKKLEEAGLVDSAAEYDKFLCQNGYDKKICAGSHQIVKGSTKEEIAREITSR